MKPLVRFTKMHGIGNDYIYVNTALYSVPDPKETAKVWSDRHKGIGSDGLVLIEKVDNGEADYGMRIFNADGSEATMCGNATRCIGKYLYDKGLTDKKVIKLNTLSGVKTLYLIIGDDGKVNKVTVDMLAPNFQDHTQLANSNGKLIDEELSVGEYIVRGTFVSMGNPHLVIFTNDIEDTQIATLGSMLEKHEIFPQGCNIEFVQVIEYGKLRARVWERGSGITLACGTGACATAAVANIMHRAGRRSTIIMDGGELEIDWKENDGHIYMTGSATFVFEGEAILP